MQHPYQTFLSINLQNLVHNFNFIKSKLNKSTKTMAVVKAFAYGHESVAIAKRLEKELVDYLAVAYIQEGINLRKAGITSPILILHPLQDDLKNCVKYHLEPNIYSFKLLETFQNKLREKEIKNFKIHLKFNTGLNRLGFDLEDISLLTSLIKTEDIFKIQSVFSHLVAGEDLKERDFTENQIATFKLMITEIEKYISYPFLKHLANTSGTLNYPEAHFDMVRMGIGLYGYGNDRKWTEKLKNVATLQSVISQIHTLKKGESVGYNRKFMAQKETRSATIPLGYADGISRTWSNGNGFVTINGKRAPLIGNVCMDMIMVNVSDIECQEGDVITIFENQEIMGALEENLKTISYELLTTISQRVPRVIFP